MTLNKEALEYAKKMVTQTADFQELDAESKFQFVKCIDIVVLNYVLSCGIQLQCKDDNQVQ